MSPILLLLVGGSGGLLVGSIVGCHHGHRLLCWLLQHHRLLCWLLHHLHVRRVLLANEIHHGGVGMGAVAARGRGPRAWGGERGDGTGQRPERGWGLGPKGSRGLGELVCQRVIQTQSLDEVGDGDALDQQVEHHNRKNNAFG